MKTSYKPFIVVIVSLLVSLTILILTSQGLRLKYEELQRVSAQLESKIKSEKNLSVRLKANYQMLTSEDIIKSFANTQLGLVDYDIENEQVMNLSEEQLSELSEAVENINE